MIRFLTMSIALLTACALLAGTASSQSLLRRGNGAEPRSLDPHFISGSWENNIVGDMFMGLMTEDAAGNAILGAAASHEVSADGRTYRFEIREDQVWSDGTPVTAHDFVYAFRRILDPKTAADYASILYVIKNAQTVNSGKAAIEFIGVRAIDDKTLEIELENPAPFFLELLTHFTTFPVPRHMVERHGEDWIKPDTVGQVISNGPYTLVHWRPNDEVLLEKNPRFFDADNVAIDRVVYYPSQDSQAALKRYRAGEIDTNSSAPVQQLEWLEKNMPGHLHIAPYVTVSYLAFNTETPPYDDRRIRWALSMAIERDVITKCILKAGQQPAYNFVPPGIANYEGGVAMDFKDLPRAERLDMARALLREAGYSEKKPLKLEFGYRESSTGRPVAVIIQAMWKELGLVQPRLLRQEAQVHYDKLRSGDFEVGDAGWIADYNDAQNFLFLVDSTSGQLNYGNYNNPEFDGLLAEAARTLDLDERSALLKRAEEVMVADQPLVPLWFSVSLNLVRPYVEGWVDNVTNIHRTRYLSIDEAARRQSKRPQIDREPETRSASRLPPRACNRG